MRLSLTDSFKCRSSFAQSISLGQISCGIIILTPTYQLNAIYSLNFDVSEFFDTTGIILMLKLDLAQNYTKKLRHFYSDQNSIGCYLPKYYKKLLNLVFLRDSCAPTPGTWKLAVLKYKKGPSQIPKEKPRLVDGV